jgi:hypothetical protein|tara:strand:+ start:65 stop:577 length:513 start_codon:yes stop_codon:yes gene_type:complete
MDFIFGTPLWKLNSDSFDEKKITEEIFNAQRSDPEGLSVSNVGGYHSGYDFDTPLTNEYIRSRLEGTGGLNVPHKVVERWFNINYKGDMMKPHTHASIGLSGVLFITDAPRLILSNPAQWVLWELFDDVHIINGKPGEIVVFPSSILHWVEPSKVETPRITYAFNIELNT